MKKLLLLLAVSLMVFSACGKKDETTAIIPEEKETVTKEPEATGPKHYTIESAIITYEFDGMQTGTSTFYFDNYGARSASYENLSTSYSGIQTGTNNNLMILDAGWVYNIDLNTNKGIKFQNFLPDDIGDEEFTENVLARELGSFGAGAKIEKLGTDEILGRTCEIMEVKKFGSKFCIWNNLILEMDMDLYGVKQHRVVTDIQENADIPEEKFMVPEGATVTHDLNVENAVKMFGN